MYFTSLSCFCMYLYIHLSVFISYYLRPSTERSVQLIAIFLLNSVGHWILTFDPQFFLNSLHPKSSFLTFNMLCDLFSWSVCRRVHPSSKGLLLLSSRSVRTETEVFVWAAYCRGCCSNTNEDRGWLRISVASTCARKHTCTHVQNLVGAWDVLLKAEEGLWRWQKGLCWHKNTVPYGLFTALICFLSLFLRLLLSVWIYVGFPVLIHGCAWLCVK